MPAVIFNGTKVKALKSELQLNTGGASVISGTLDPTSSAVDAVAGSLYQNTSTGVVYRKLDSGSSTNWAALAASLNSSADIQNLTVTASVAANALTVAVKTKAGTDPSASDPVVIGTRSSTASSGSYNTRSLTSALSLVVSSGSTLGQRSAKAGYLYVYLIDNAGTLELAICGAPISDSAVVSTTAEGGAGAADSVRVMYSTTARSNVPARLIARLTQTQATAGTWATAPSAIWLTPPGAADAEHISVHASQTAGASGTNNSQTTAPFTNVNSDSHNSFSSNVFTVPVSDYYSFSGQIPFAANVTGSRYATLRVNTTDITLNQNSVTPSATVACYIPLATVRRFLNAGDTVEIQYFQNSGGALSFDVGIGMFFSISRG